jgi:hypothetical protein
VSKRRPHVGPPAIEDFETTIRQRGLKGFRPEHLPAFQDPLFADDPVFWILQADLGAGGAAFSGHAGIETPDIGDRVVIVDGILASPSASDVLQVWVVQGSDAVRAALATDQQVHLRNRREQGANPGFPARAGLLRIADNGNAITGQGPIVSNRTGANTGVVIPLGHRLYKLEQLWVANQVLNIALTVTMWGRITRRT